RAGQQGGVVAVVQSPVGRVAVRRGAECGREPGPDRRGRYWVGDVGERQVGLAPVAAWSDGVLADVAEPQTAGLLPRDRDLAGHDAVAGAELLDGDRAEHGDLVERGGDQVCVDGSPADTVDDADRQVQLGALFGDRDRSGDRPGQLDHEVSVVVVVRGRWVDGQAPGAGNDGRVPEGQAAQVAGRNRQVALHEEAVEAELAGQRVGGTGGTGHGEGALEVRSAVGGYGVGEVQLGQGVRGLSLRPGEGGDRQLAAG